MGNAMNESSNGHMLQVEDLNVYYGAIYALKGIFLKGIGISILYPSLLLLAAFAIFIVGLAARQVPRQIKEKRG